MYHEKIRSALLRNAGVTWAKTCNTVLPPAVMLALSRLTVTATACAVPLAVPPTNTPINATTKIKILILQVSGTSLRSGKTTEEQSMQSEAQRGPVAARRERAVPVTAREKPRARSNAI